MEFRVFVEPQQGATYADQAAVAQRAEQLGFDGFFRSDHYLKMGAVSGLPGPTDAWVTLAGLAVQTERIRLGTLVTAATFRLPGPLAISVAQADQMSGGRIELGIGAAWYDDEHRAYGIGFPVLGERFDMLTEQLEILRGLWTTPEGETFSFAGRHYTLTDSPALPKPVQRPHPPIIMGGIGPRRTPALAARFAAEFNCPFFAIEDATMAWARVRERCEREGRDPGSMVLSAALVVCVGGDEEEFTRRTAAIGRQPEELRRNGVAGLAQEAADTLGTWKDAGAERIYLQVLDMSDLEHLDLIASDVLPSLR